jgi:hypothetical protein
MCQQSYLLEAIAGQELGSPPIFDVFRLMGINVKTCLVLEQHTQSKLMQKSAVLTSAYLICACCSIFPTVLKSSGFVQTRVCLAYDKCVRTINGGLPLLDSKHASLPWVWV